MSQLPMTVDAKDSAVSALRTMRKRAIRHLPVTRKERLLGMVTERDLLRVLPGHVAAAPEQKDCPMPVTSALTTELISISPNATIDQAAALLLEHKISGIPVMEQGRLVGIVTSDDILKAFVSVFDQETGVQLTMVHGTGTNCKPGFDPAATCAQLGMRLLQLSSHDARRGAAVFVLSVEGSEEELDAFKLKAGEYGWLPLRDSSSEQVEPQEDAA